MTHNAADILQKLLLIARLELYINGWNRIFKLKDKCPDSNSRNIYDYKPNQNHEASQVNVGFPSTEIRHLRLIVRLCE